MVFKHHPSIARILPWRMEAVMIETDTMERASGVADKVSISQRGWCSPYGNSVHHIHMICIIFYICILLCNRKIKTKQSHLIQAEVPMPLSNSLPEAMRKRI